MILERMGKSEFSSSSCTPEVKNQEKQRREKQKKECLLKEGVWKCKLGGGGGGRVWSLDII